MAAAYPASIASFLTYQNQPGDSNHIVSDPNNPGQTIDLTIDRAATNNEIHDEVVAIEETLGFNLGQSLTFSISDLFNGKSAGHADPVTGNVPPLPMPSHVHPHALSNGLGADDHPQYMRVDASRGFSAAVSAPNAVGANQLITLNQALASGLNYNQVQAIIQNTLAGASANPMTGPAPQRYKMAGGRFYGYTNAGGNIWIDFGPTHFAGVLTLVFMKMPYSGPSHYGYVYRYEEDQINLLSISNTGAMVQFIEDIAVDRQALVQLCWIAIGV